MKSTNIALQQVSPLFEIRKNIQSNYKSIFASQDLKPNTLLSKFHYLEKLTQPTRYTVQIGDEEHIVLQPDYLRYINHSCHPNVFFDTSKGELITLRTIEIGDEISFFYPSTEWKMDESFECSCGNTNCLKQIQGAAYLSTENLKKYKLTDFVLSKL